MISPKESLYILEPRLWPDIEGDNSENTLGNLTLKEQATTTHIHV